MILFWDCQIGSKQYQMGSPLQSIKPEEEEEEEEDKLSLIHPVITAADAKCIWFIYFEYILNNICLSFPTLEAYKDDGYFQTTEESNQFRQEYEMRKMKQACKTPAWFQSLMFVLKSEGIESYG